MISRTRCERLINFLYGEVDYDEMPRIMWLSALLCAIIGGFWLLDSLKDTVLATTVGLEYQPRAKVLSVCVTLIVVSIYNGLIDRVSKPALFYAIGFTYFILFVILGGCLAHRSFGMENTSPDPHRLLGWFTYFAIESYGSLAVALFWAFTNASIDLESAKSSYGLIVAFAQLGAIFGSTLATKASAFHISFLFVLGGSSCLLVCAMVRGYEIFFMIPAQILPAHPSENTTQQSANKIRSNVHLFDGISLVLRHGYVTSLLAISTLYEVILTVLDFEMKIIGRARYSTDERGAEQFAELMGHFGQTVNTISFIFSLAGFSYVVRRLGLSITLLVFPFLLIVGTLVTYASPGLWTLFITTALLKALTYSLNEPALEMLYVPTSEPIKFKAKAWIDVVGARSAKAAGSAINDFVQRSPYLRTNLPQYGNVPALLVSIILLAVSAHVGSRFESLVEDGHIVGEQKPNSHLYRSGGDHRGSYELITRLASSRSEDDDDAKSIFGAIARENNR
uniref:ADP,ATP carrier protein n=1 Tax=Aureoumbra lagunensis TaxID=44058 RepID=A0A7S3JRE1_9STRA